MKCLNCNKNIQANRKYCSVKCQQSYQNEAFIQRWKNGEENGKRGDYNLSDTIRNYLFKKYNNKCSKCNWSEVNSYSGKIPLEVDHIDGNFNNNKEENLRLLCPNCHSLTSTYKRLNKKGRQKRKKYSK